MRLPLWASHTSFCATCHGEGRKSDDASVAATATHQMPSQMQSQVVTPTGADAVDKNRREITPRSAAEDTLLTLTPGEDVPLRPLNKKVHHEPCQRHCHDARSHDVGLEVAVTAHDDEAEPRARHDQFSRNDGCPGSSQCDSHAIRNERQAGRYSHAKQQLGPTRTEGARGADQPGGGTCLIAT